MANSFMKHVTGNNTAVDTEGGLTPLTLNLQQPINAPFSSGSVTAQDSITFGDPAGTQTSFAAGDILFYTDGYTMYDSDGNVMDGQS